MRPPANAADFLEGALWRRTGIRAHASFRIRGDSATEALEASLVSGLEHIPVQVLFQAVLLCLGRIEHLVRLPIRIGILVVFLCLIQ